jgi:hypothetical protein
MGDGSHSGDTGVYIARYSAIQAPFERGTRLITFTHAAGADERDDLIRQRTIDSESERQATALKCWTDFSHLTMRFQLVKFWLTTFTEFS